MDYYEFRTTFLEALQKSGLPLIGLAPSEEVLDLRTTDRTLTVYVAPMGREIGKPFHVSGAISWRWNALQAARTASTEEDLIAELLGQDQALAVETERPWLRVDLELRASVEYGKAIPFPAPAAWAGWAREATGRLRNIEPLVGQEVARETSEENHTVLAWQGEPEIKLTCSATGELRLEAMAVRAFQGVDLPRRWDDQDREQDDDPYEQLARMFERVKAALYAWGEVMDHLVGNPAPSA